MANLNETPNANRIHIGFFGRRNSGKSSLINIFTGQEVSIVADYAGTTTDPVYKAMEIHPLGPCTIIDTAETIIRMNCPPVLLYSPTEMALTRPKRRQWVYPFYGF